MPNSDLEERWFIVPQNKEDINVSLDCETNIDDNILNGYTGQLLNQESKTLLRASLVYRRLLALVLARKLTDTFRNMFDNCVENHREYMFSVISESTIIDGFIGYHGIDEDHRRKEGRKFWVRASTHLSVQRSPIERENDESQKRDVRIPKLLCANLVLTDQALFDGCEALRNLGAKPIGPTMLFGEVDFKSSNGEFSKEKKSTKVGAEDEMHYCWMHRKESDKSCGVSGKNMSTDGTSYSVDLFYSLFNAAITAKLKEIEDFSNIKTSDVEEATTRTLILKALQGQLRDSVERGEILCRKATYRLNPLVFSMTNSAVPEVVIIELILVDSLIQ